MGATADGTKELIAVIDGIRKSKLSWSELLPDLMQGGLTKLPNLAIGNGAIGFCAVRREFFPTIKEPRCWVHTAANVLNKLPKSLQSKAKNDLH